MPNRVILHVVGSLAREWGGLSLFVARLAAHQAAAGDEVFVSCPTPSHPTQENWDHGSARVVAGSIGKREWRGVAQRADVIHVHGLWLLHYHRALAWARSTGKPYMLSVHGMLEPGAMRFSSLKKRLAMAAYQHRDLRLAPVLHATASAELQTIRRRGYRSPVLTVPPGVDWPSVSTPVPAEQRQMLFLGRIHPKKGLLELVEAWGKVLPRGWRLVVAGPDEGGHLQVVQRAAASLGNSVEWCGPLFGSAKQTAIETCSVLIAPSHSENFGIVIAEALAAGRPVITTTGTPWKLLAEHHCGWWVNPDAVSLGEAIAEAAHLPASRLNAMGERGRQLVRERFSWPAISSAFRSTYDWICDGGSAPGELTEAESLKAFR